jgi:hypothetical protein
MVSCSPARSARVATYDTFPSPPATTSQRSLEPVKPWKHADLVTAAGARTAAETRADGTPQSGPFTFQYSSSCCSNALRAPRTV